MIAKAFAPAKINLTLHVTGQREDGYHLLDSLVVFADIGDQLEFRPASSLSMKIDGPEAANLSVTSDNLVLRAAALFHEGYAEITLTKNLPVASGIGGGSADAAATLRGMSSVLKRSLPLSSDCLSLGADVPVCLVGRPTRMQGIGDVLTPVPNLPNGLGVVLVNPRVTVPTPAVFKTLETKTNPPMSELPREWGNSREFCDWLKTQRNDLQAPAIANAPQILDVLQAFEQTDPLITRMSGSGATCFALFESRVKAEQAAITLGAERPDWWVKAGQVLTQPMG